MNRHQKTLTCRWLDPRLSGIHRRSQRNPKYQITIKSISEMVCASQRCAICEGEGISGDADGLVGCFAGGILGSFLGVSCLGGCLGGLSAMLAAHFQLKKCSFCGGSGSVDLDVDIYSSQVSTRSTTACDAADWTPRGWHQRGGRTMRMYHGTSAESAQSIRSNGFNPSSRGMLGEGVYVSSDIEKAKRYGTTILIVEVKLGKTKKIDSQTHPMRTSWHTHGYDSAWVPPNCGMVSCGLTETCVFDRDRIRVISTM